MRPEMYSLCEVVFDISCIANNMMNAYGPDIDSRVVCSKVCALAEKFEKHYNEHIEEYQDGTLDYSSDVDEFAIRELKEFFGVDTYKVKIGDITGSVEALSLVDAVKKVKASIKSGNVDVG